MELSATSGVLRARARAVWALVALAVVVLAFGAVRASAAPAFVQVASKEVRTGTVNGVAFPSAVKAGGTIVVYTAWSNTGTATVADNRGNTYAPVGAAQAWGTSWRGQVFVAKNVAAGATTVTVTYGTAITDFGIVYAHEYSGLDPANPVDVNRSASGTGKSITSGALATTNANDLLFTGIASDGTITSVGTGWTVRSNAFGNRTADRVVTQAGSYTATAAHNQSAWEITVVALRAAGGDTTAPSVPTGLSATAASSSRIDLSWNAATDDVGVTNYVITRNGTQIVTPTNATQFADTGLSPSTGYTYTVAARDAAGNVSAASAPPVTTSTQAAPGDTQNPVATITAPGAGATVSGAALQVTATATDDTGVAGVQFLLDGNPLGAEDTTAPYAVTWDTTTASNGPHTLTARARDAAGNTGTSPGVTVTVSNGGSQGPGPQAAYAFEENAGVTTADVSGHGITGTLTNGPGWVAGRYGRAVQLDGADDFVDLGNPTALQMTGSMTVSAWVRSTAFPSDDAAIVSKRATQGWQLDITPDRGPRTIGFKLSASGGDMFRYGQTTLQTGTWYHVAGVYDATARTMHVYLNGQLDDGTLAGTVAAAQVNSSANVDIGRRPSGGFLTTGVIDDVRIYNRALSASEVLADMQTGLGGAGPTDGNAPQVSLTAPAAGAQVSQIVNITATASDDVGVAGV
ncbi:MAG TPA: LamG-like jellyroll fold domain-containing protein, partial [Miltoncostaea sp.]|nr:LamG-like jellyroll fold domain-containing protein [Miltoncostaea sp.]